MTPAATRLSVEEYDRIYGHRNGWEYWFGEARQKSVPTHLHGLLAGILFELLQVAGYIAAVEAEMRFSDWRPRPDVYGVLDEVAEKYVTRPVDVAFEVYSEGDSIIEKCRYYTEAGVPQVFVFYPEIATIDYWDGTQLVAVADVILKNGVTITGQTIWSRLEERQRRPPLPASNRI